MKVIGEGSWKVKGREKSRDSRNRVRKAGNSVYVGKENKGLQLEEEYLDWQLLSPEEFLGCKDTFFLSFLFVNDC